VVAKSINSNLRKALAHRFGGKRFEVRISYSSFVRLSAKVLITVGV
jgi:hypothetical protein